MSSVARGAAIAPVSVSAPIAPQASQVTAKPRDDRPEDRFERFSPPKLTGPGGAAIATRHVPISGLGAVTNDASSTMSRFQRDTLFDSYTADASSAVTRGFIKVDASAIPGGCRVRVESFHSNRNDSVTLYLLAEVMDTQSNQLRTVTLAVMAKDANLNGSTFRGDNYFDISYAEVEQYLRARNPNLRLTPGVTTLGVAARWASGHQAGGFGRGGTFRVPGVPPKQSVLSILTGAAPAAADLPLDMQVGYPAGLVSQVPQLKAGGSIVSRLESELKGTADQKSMVAAVSRMYQLAASAKAGDKQEIEAILGKHWTISTVDRYWQKDDGSAGLPGKAGTGIFAGFRVDEHGLPIQDPMLDVYFDDQNLTMTRQQGVLRLRKNKQATVFNMKPGAGRRDDDTAIVQRIEVGLELVPDATTRDVSQALSALAQGQWSGTVFNHAQREAQKLDKSLVLAQALNPFLEVLQNRHKFTLRNEKTGVEVELSLDHVMVKTLRQEHQNADGTARTAEFFVLEAELDHLQLQSANQSSFAAGGAANSSSGFSTDAQQEQWLRNTSSSVTMDLDPRLHELRDLDNESFRRTASYKEFEGVAKSLVPALFKGGLGYGRQKAAHAAEVVGLVAFSDQALLSSLRDAVRSGGYVWSTGIEEAFEKVAADPKRRPLVERALASGQARAVPALLASAGVQEPLTYDLPALHKRIAGRLASLGLAMTPAVAAVIARLDASKLRPDALERELAGMENQADASVLNGICAAVGERNVPAPRPEPSLLFAQPSFSTQLTTALAQTHVDPKQRGAIEAYYAEAVAKGLSLLELRRSLSHLGTNPEAHLQQLASRPNMSPAPALRPDLDSMARSVAPQLRTHHVQFDAALSAFVAKVTAGQSRAEALATIQRMGNDPRAFLDREAARFGVQPPKLAYDWASIDGQLTQVAAQARVVYDAGLRRFVRDVVEAGMPVTQVQRILNNLSQGASLAQAMRNAGVYMVPTLTLPQVAYDLPAIRAGVQQALGGIGPYVSPATLDRWISALLAAGFSASQLVQLAGYLQSYGHTQSIGYTRVNVAASNVPTLPVDADLFVQDLTKRYGAAFTAAHAAFVKAALPAALANLQAPLQYLTQQGLPSLLNLLAQASRVPLPASGAA